MTRAGATAREHVHSSLSALVSFLSALQQQRTVKDFFISLIIKIKGQVLFCYGAKPIVQVQLPHFFIFKIEVRLKWPSIKRAPCLLRMTGGFMRN